MWMDRNLMLCYICTIQLSNLRWICFWKIRMITRWTTKMCHSLFEGFMRSSLMQNVALTMINEIMDTRVVEIRQKLESGESFPKSGEMRTPSMLELLNVMTQEDPNCITDEQGIDHLMTFMATSQDTQSSAIAFTLMMLGAYPHIQDLVVQELREVLGERKSSDWTDVSKLKYLDICIKESMRVYLVAPFIFRETTEDFHLEKLTIPEGVTVALSIYHAHRDKNYWEKPEEFYPELFLPVSVNQRHPYAFIPFSAGPRKCIAQQCSYTDTKILHQFDYGYIHQTGWWLYV